MKKKSIGLRIMNQSQLFFLTDAVAQPMLAWLLRRIASQRGIPMSKKKVLTKRGVKIETVLQVQHPAWEQRL